MSKPAENRRSVAEKIKPKSKRAATNRLKAEHRRNPQPSRPNNRIPPGRIETAREGGLEALTRWNCRLKPLQDGRCPPDRKSSI